MCLASGSAWAGDWPQFRGPGGQGHASDGAVPLTWSESEHIRWKTPIPGSGWSSPSVLGNRIWLTTATEGNRSLRVLALDRRTGAIQQDVEVLRPDPGKIHQKNSHASPTPVLEGDRVYVHYGAHGTAALDAKDGSVVWKKRLDYDHRHGPGNSPILYDDLLIVNCDGYDQQFIVAFDKNTGQQVWRKTRPGYQAYCTPLVIFANGREQLISPGAKRSIAYDPRTGEELWWVLYGEGFSNVPRPVFANGLVFICTGFFQPSLYAVRPDGEGDVTGTHIVWQTNRGVPLTPSPIVVGDELYMVTDQGVGSCLDTKTGKVHWRQRLGGNYSASPVLAGGRIYFPNEEGETNVIAPGTAYELLATNRLEEAILASMAVVDGAIYLRTSQHLYCIAG